MGQRGNVTIETLLEQDIDGAVAIDLVSFVSGELGEGREDPRVVRERSLREELARPWSRLRAARGDSGTLLGYSLFWHVVDELHLLNVAVALPHRRRGIGRALMADLLAYAQQNKIARVLLEVRASNVGALGLYESLGFDRFNVRAAYYADGEDAVEMSLGFPG